VRALWVVALGGCVGQGLFTDGTSVSVGSFNGGVLRRGARLPPSGEGYQIPPLWVQRQSNYGTDELVAAIEHAARRVAREYPGGVLGIGDLSLRGGAETALHHSHRNGRDADLIYYAVDDGGRPVAPPESMPRYSGPEGRARPPLPPEHGVVYKPFSPRRFDVRRNWALVRALLEEPRIEVQYLFVHQRIRAALLSYAESVGEDPSLIERAEAILRQPGDSAAHDDHMHLRIFCARDDRQFGCTDRGPLRWWKKRYKYMAPEETQRMSVASAQLVAMPPAWIPGFFP
jgi:penicillin-insensitive murein endopeptidase